MGAALFFPQFFGEAKGVLLLFGRLHLVLLNCFHVQHRRLFLLQLFHDYPIPFPEFNVSENPDFSCSETDLESGTSVLCLLCVNPFLSSNLVLA